MYRDTADTIIAAALADTNGWAKLAHLTDRIGHRLSGSESLERAVSWAASAMKADGHENVRLEEVSVTHWVRGAESARIDAPAAHTLHILGLGGTVGTPKGGITADVIVASSFEALAELGPKVKGKIVLYTNRMAPYSAEHGAGYGAAVKYRWEGASKAAALGAKAVLVRSVTARSLSTPHTGAMGYESDVPKIPAAAVSIEGAELIDRLIQSGERVRVTLKLGARTLPNAKSHNVIAELVGRELPDEVVVIGGHIDSWDVGQGAHDDGTGCVMMMQALTLLRELGLRPRRTIRVVLFTNEENGLAGAKTYATEHAAELSNHVAAIESDSGGFAPKGFQVQAEGKPVDQARDIVSLLAAIDATKAETGFSGSDIMPLATAGVPSLGLSVDGRSYFDYHHTHADTLDKVDPLDFRKDIAAVAVMAFVLADMPSRFGAVD